MCYKNWNGTSTSMEVGIILDGFKKSLDVHHLRYRKIIGDGSSSVVKKIRIGKPYVSNYFVYKTEMTRGSNLIFFKRIFFS
jgi:hypothetical protein